MMKLGPGAGTMESGEERTPFEKLYTVDMKEEDGQVRYRVTSPSGVRGEAVIDVSEKDEKKTLRFTKLFRTGMGADVDRAALVMLKGLIVTAKNELEKNGDELGYVEIPADEPELAPLFSVSAMGEIFGAREIEAVKKFYNPEREEGGSKKAAAQPPEPIRLSLWEITERLKEYEQRHGTIRQ